MYNPKLRARLHRIRIPTLFLWGAHDGFAPLAYGRGYCEGIPGAKFEEIADSGHFPHMEQTEALARRVVEVGPERQGGAGGAVSGNRLSPPPRRRGRE